MMGRSTHRCVKQWTNTHGWLKIENVQMVLSLATLHYLDLLNEPQETITADLLNGGFRKQNVKLTHSPVRFPCKVLLTSSFNMPKDSVTSAGNGAVVGHGTRRGLLELRFGRNCSKQNRALCPEVYGTGQPYSRFQSPTLLTTGQASPEMFLCFQIQLLSLQFD